MSVTAPLGSLAVLALAEPRRLERLAGFFDFRLGMSAGIVP